MWDDKRLQNGVVIPEAWALLRKGGRFTVSSMCKALNKKDGHSDKFLVGKYLHGLYLTMLLERKRNQKGVWEYWLSMNISEEAPIIYRDAFRLPAEPSLFSYIRYWKEGQHVGS